MAEHVAEEAVKHVKTKAHEAADAVSHTARKIKRTVRRTVREVNGRSNGRHNGSHNSGLLAIQKSAAGAINGLTEQLGELKEKGLQTTEAVENTILKNPKSSVAIAFGVGYILAKDLLRMGHRRARIADSSDTPLGQ